MIQLKNTVVNRARAGMSRNRSTSHRTLKKKGASSTTSATVAVMPKARKDSTDTATESRVQAVTLVRYTDFSPPVERSRVSRVPSSRSS